MHPYINAKCQEKLFEVIVTFYEENTLTIFPNINVALYILNKSRNSKNLKIAETCEKGIGYLEVLCQPICPSLFGLENSLWNQPSNTDTIFNDVTHELQQQNDENCSNLEQNDSYDNHNMITDTLETTNDTVISIADENSLETDFQENVTERDSSVHILDVQIISTSKTEEHGNDTLKREMPCEVELDQTGKL